LWMVEGPLGRQIMSPAAHHVLKWSLSYAALFACCLLCTRYFMFRDHTFTVSTLFLRKV
jgi:hypothetical protein